MIANALDGLSRRSFLSATGALVVALVTPAEFAVAADAAHNGMAARPLLTPDKLSSYVSIEPDGTVVGYYGKIDGGQGLKPPSRNCGPKNSAVPGNRCGW